MKLKVCSYYLKKEKLARLIKSQKLRGQKKTVPERLTLVIIKIKNISKRKSTSRVKPNLELIKKFPRSAPTADRMVPLQINALKPARGATKVNQRILLAFKNINLMK